MKLNEEKLDQMVEAVMEKFVQKVSMFNYAEFELITRTALTPFAMEMTDEEIENEFEKEASTWSFGERGSSTPKRFYEMGAKFIRDGK